MNNFEHAIEATKTGLNSAGSAAQENSRYMESLQAQLTQLQATFQELANNVISSDLAGVLLKIANALLDIFNTPLGTFVAQIGLLGSALWGGSGLIKAMQIIPNLLDKVGTAFSLFGKTISISTPQIYLISAGIVTLISVVSSLIDVFSRTPAKKFDEITTELNNLESQLQSNKDRLTELNDIPWYDRTKEINDEIEALQAENNQLKENIELQKEAQYSSAIESFGEGKYLDTGVGVNLVEASRYLGQEASNLEGFGIGGTIGLDFIYTAAKQIEESERSFSSAGEAAQALAFTLDGVVRSEEESLALLEQIGVDVNSLFEKEYFASSGDLPYEDRIKKMKSQSEELLKVMQSELESTGRISEETQAKYEGFISVYSDRVEEANTIIAVQRQELGTLNELGQAAQEYLNIFSNTQTLYDNYTSKAKNLDNAFQENINSINELNDSIKELQSFDEINIVEVIEQGREVINDTTEDIEEFGSIGADTFATLTSIIPDLTNEIMGSQLGIEGLDGALFNANGTLTNSGTIALNSAGSFKEFARAVLEAQIAINSAKITELNYQYESYGKSADNLVKELKAVSEYYGYQSSQRASTLNRYLENKEQMLGSQEELLRLEQSQRQLQAIYDNFDKLFTTASTGGGSGGRGSASETAESEVSEAERILEQFYSWQENKEAELFLIEQHYSQAERDLQKAQTEENIENEERALEQLEYLGDKRISQYKNVQNIIHSYANKLRNMGYRDEDELVQKLIQLWWEYQDEINSVQDAIDERREESRQKELEAQQAQLEQAREELRQELEEQKQAQIDAIEEEIEANEKLQEALQDKIDAMEVYADWMVDQIDKEIENIDKEIAALDEVNQELEDQIALEEKLDALARARNTMMMVYKDGRFQYVSDIDAVSQAQSDLEEYEREQALQDKKDALEEEKEILQGYKDEWASLTEKYQEEQDKLLVLEQLGIDLEKENWQDRLDNFQNFYDDYADIMGDFADLVDEFNKLQQELQDAMNQEIVVPEVPSSGTGGSLSGSGAALGGGAGAIIGGVIGGATGGFGTGILGGIIGGITGAVSGALGGSGNKGSSSSSGNGVITSDKGYTVSTGKGQSFILDAPAGSTMTGGDGSQWTKNPDGSTTVVHNGTTHTFKSNKRASGVFSNPTDSIDLVGEKGPEFRFNSEGSSIMPNNMTKNLWAWGMTTPSKMMSSLSAFSSNPGQTITISIQNFNPSLPNVQNGEDFAIYMRDNFWRQTIQYSTKRNKM